MLNTISRQEMLLDSKLTTAASLPTLAGPNGAPEAVTSVNGQTGDVVLGAEDGVFPINNDGFRVVTSVNLTSRGSTARQTRSVQMRRTVQLSSTMPSGPFMTPKSATMSSSSTSPIPPSTTAAVRMAEPAPGWLDSHRRTRTHGADRYRSYGANWDDRAGRSNWNHRFSWSDGYNRSTWDRHLLCGRTVSRNGH
ncbi:hypothetical protein MKY96_06100 [Paenibacillus sp. FSL R7-0302]|uniref:hypothetical protein n=1 Tax=Paenibacillus sp. FSL R7-0302 TaxID=2921681 RepID=UPI0030F68AC7